MRDSLANPPRPALRFVALLDLASAGLSRGACIYYFKYVAGVEDGLGPLQSRRRILDRTFSPPLRVGKLPIGLTGLNVMRSAPFLFRPGRNASSIGSGGVRI